MAAYEGPYQEDRPCPACEMAAGNKSRFITKTITKPDKTIIKKYGIRRTCSRCGYGWNEKALFEVGG